jgi:hypothetical protein
MKTLYKVIIVLVAATLLVAALGSAFNQIATSPILTKKLNSQDGNQDLPVPDIPQNVTLDPSQHPYPPDMDGTILPPKLNITIPNGTQGIAGTTGGNVSGKVFVDYNGDGLPGPEEGQPNVGVLLYDRNGTLVGTTQTDSLGYYDFTGLAPGKYNVSAFPGGNVSASRSIDMGNGTLNGVDLETTLRPATDPTVFTITDITSPVSQFLIKKGVRFQVTGTVTTDSLQPVSGLPVMVFVASNKTLSVRHFIGEGTLVNGHFAEECLIPNDLKLGNYQLIAVFQGNATYRMSVSDPAVKVMDDTKISIDSPDRVIIGIPYTITFSLKENASSKAVSSATLVSTDTISVITTDGSGVGHATMKWSTPGIYSVSIVYAGNGTLYGTTANKTVTALDVSVDTAPPYLVRGYDNRLFVLVHASELPVSHRVVMVYLDSDMVTADQTDGEGRLNITVPIPYSHALGPVQMFFDINNVKRCELDLNVMSATTMKASIVGNQVNATLLDDHGQVMLQMPIQLLRMDQSKVDSGNSKAGSEFSLNPGEGSDFTVKFNGTSIYRPSSAVVHYSPSGPGSLMDWLIIGGLVAMAALAAIGFLFFRNRKRRRPAQNDGALPVPVTPGVLPTSPYSIKFPEIAEGLPLVWGENDPMLFHVSGGQGDLDLDIDGRGSVLSLESGFGAYTVKLPKGDHRLSVSGPLGSTAMAVRVVDYREETVRLYRSSFESWKGQGIAISDSMTPREMQSTMEGRVDPSLHGQLDVVVSLFEIAQFSQRPIGRPEYESMFRASDRVR